MADADAARVKPGQSPGMLHPERILVVHERYRQRGGEDAVFEAEADLLERHGHRVERLVVDNTGIPDQPSLRQATRLAVGTVWSPEGARLVRRATQRFRPEVVHVHNTFPLLSPAVHAAAHAAGAATVQTLHNYRLTCPAAILFRDGRYCEDCVGRAMPWPSVVHGCFHASRLRTVPVAALVAVHRARGTWQRDVDRIIALSSFQRSVLLRAGLDPGRVVEKPNFINDPGEGGSHAGGFLFAGRLAPEKGVAVLLDAWATGIPVPCRVVGNGPLEDVVRRASAASAIEPLGRLANPAVLAEMRDARALILPSIWPEGGLPLVAIEAFASGLPVIASRIGNMAEAITDRRTGLLFEPGDARGLAAAARTAIETPDVLRAMGRAAREEYLARFAPDRGYEHLLRIYSEAIAVRRAATSAGRR
jgi:glycosyltransferase involved in cell wall biosynthesis